MEKEKEKKRRKKKKKEEKHAHVHGSQVHRVLDDGWIVGNIEKDWVHWLEKWKRILVAHKFIQNFFTPSEPIHLLSFFSRRRLLYLF
jgi:hypothetical protein